MSNKLVLFCGPSGSGKTTIVHHLLGKLPILCFSISATTRKKRASETYGRDYYFLSHEEFQEKIRNNEFLEWEEVYEGGFYGTLKSEVDRISATNRIPIFDLDVEGGLHLKQYFSENMLDVFVRPPHLGDLRGRLLSRATETKESLEKRILKAELELTYSDQFSHQLINQNMDETLLTAEGLVMQFLGVK
ncbi:MAG TPA: guanylate kinase [Bacteroidia bacterium]|nr:guanylate kinase [Bacteroidia bacterium]